MNTLRVSTLFLLLTNFLFSQTPCFEKYKQQGDEHLHNQAYEEAIDAYLEALNCADQPASAENQVPALLRGAFQSKVDQLNNQVNEEKREKETAQHLARAGSNAIRAISTLRRDPTLALNMAAYNYDRYPDNEAAASAFREVFNSGELFYKAEVTGPTYVTSVAFTPDSKNFLIGRRGGFTGSGMTHTLELYDVHGQLIRSLATASGDSLADYDGVETLALSVDGNLVLSGGYSDSLAVLRTLAGDPICVIQNQPAESVALSPDGRYMITGSDNSPPVVWDVQKGEIVKTLVELSAANVLFSPRGDRFLIRSDDDYCYLGSLDGTISRNLPDDGEFYFYPIRDCFSRDGSLIATGGQVVKLWSEEGEMLKEFSGFRGYATATGISPDGQFILAGNTFGEVIIWNRYGQTIHTLPAHKEVVTALAFSPDGRFFLTGSSDLGVRLWTWDSNDTRILGKEIGTVQKVEFHTNGRQIISIDGHGQVVFWNRQSGQIERTFQSSAPYLQPAFAVSPSGKFLLCGTEDSTAVLWDLDSGSQLHTFEGHRSIAGYPSNVMSVAFSPDEKMALTTSSDRTVKLWDLKTKKLLQNYVDGSGGLFDAVFTPDNQKILFCSRDRTIKLFGLDGQFIRSYGGHEEWIMCLDISPDGQHIVSGGFEGQILLHHIDGRLLHSFLAPNEPVNDVQFSPDGKFIATAALDNTARIWDLNGQEIQVLKGHENSVQSIAFSSDGKSVITGSVDSGIRIWPTHEVIIENNIAKLPLYKLLESGLSISKQDLQTALKSNTSPSEILGLYRYSQKEGIDLDVVSTLLAAAKADLIKGYIRTLMVDLSAFTRENLMEQLTGNYERRMDYYSQMNQLLTHLLTLEKNPADYAEYAGYLNDYGWHQLLTGDFKGAESTVRRGLALDSSNPYLNSNLPPSLLLQGKYDEATAFYTEKAGLVFPVGNNPSKFATIFIEDLEELEKEGVIPDAHLDKVEEIKKMLSEK